MNEWISINQPPDLEDPILVACMDEDGIKYVAIGWHNKSTGLWSDNLAGKMLRETTVCIGWMPLPVPPDVR